MKKLALVFFGVMFLYGSGLALATTITDEVDFSGSGIYQGRTYISFLDYFSYSHDFPALNTPPDIINGGKLTLTHKTNKDYSSVEVWFASADNQNSTADYFIGRLDWSDTRWVTQTWKLSTQILNEMALNHPWRLDVKMVEQTSGVDGLWLDKSVLTVQYNNVPEPGTMFLLGSLATGLFGFAGLRRRFTK